MDIRRWPIEALRIYTGSFFAYHGWTKLTREQGFDATGFVTAMQDKAFAFYQPFIESTILPNIGLVSSLVTWGELLIGVALVLGLATRYAAFAGAIMVANFWFAKGSGFFSAQNYDLMWLVIFLVLALVPAGKTFGLDRPLAVWLPFLR